MLPSTYPRKVSNGIQLLAAAALPIFQVVVPSYSERWFDLKGRTTATMIMGLGMCFSPPPLFHWRAGGKFLTICAANPVGNALGQLIPPLISTTRQSVRLRIARCFHFSLIAHQILVMAIIFTAAAPIVFFVGEAPPTPPSMSDCGLVPWLVAHHVTRSIRRYPQAPFAVFSHACDARKGAA